jgi:hypothetical protein
MRDSRVMVSNHVQQMSANGVNTIVAGNPTVFVEHFEQVQALWRGAPEGRNSCQK